MSRLKNGGWRSAGWRRSLKITRAGYCLIAIALAAGLGALNTGNNPLFLAWGMVLGAMVVSGVLSEAVLRPLTVALKLPDEVRAGLPTHLRATLTNTSRFVPAMAVEVLVTCTPPHGAPQVLRAPYELRLDAKKSRELFVPLALHSRGVHTLTGLTVRTAYPFGLFIKDRPLTLASTPLLVLPAQAASQPGVSTLRGQVGEHPAALAGDGEDYFATRAYREGDPLRHVLWRRVAKSQRWLVVERETRRSQRLVVALAFVADASEAAIEAAIAAAGTLTEALLAQGLAVGLDAPGVRIAPGADGAGLRGQRRALLTALALLDVRAGLPPARANRGAAHTVQLVAPGLALPKDAAAARLHLNVGGAP